MTCCTCCQPLSESQRIDYPAALFGASFPFVIEPAIFSAARQLSVDYTGGLWDFYALSNGGFYMAPQSPRLFHVRCENGFTGELSAGAFGVTVCLYAFSQLSFDESEPLARVCADQYDLLREHMLDHREVRSIVAAIE